MQNHADKGKDVLILFPRKQGKSAKEHISSPLDELILESELMPQREYVSAPLFSENAEQLNLGQLTDSLEIRLNVLEEVESRLKFYLDDIELSSSFKK